MGNVHMEASMINYRGGDKKMSVEEAIKAGSSYELPIASAATLGGVKIGSGISIAEGGAISADAQLPADPATDGKKVLTATTAEGSTTLSWEDPESGGVDYSTTEQNTGLKWIDGKDIFVKTFSSSESFTIGVDWTSTGLEISGADLIIDAKFVRYESKGLVSCDFNLNSGVVRVNRAASLGCANGYAVTAYYTKASA